MAPYGPGPAPVRPTSNEPTLDELLAEPIIRQLMQRDRTDEAATRHLLQQIAAASLARQTEDDLAEDDPGLDDPTRFARLLQQTARVLRDCCERELRIRVPGLTAARCAVLVHLAEHQGVNQASLADSLGIRPITLVRLLDRLAADGLVARLPAPGDRRAHLLVLTPKARPILDHANGFIREINDDLQLGISTTEASQLRMLLRRIRSNLADRLHGAASSEPLKARRPA